MQPKRATALLLNIGHAIDHLLLLVFATAVGAIAADFAMAWEDLMPFSVGAFVLFGLCSLPAGRLGDLWGRRAMMIVFFLGCGVATLGVAAARGPWEMAAALTLLGAFAAIYHPVGIPMLVQGAQNPGWTIGVNGLAGNLGIAVAAIMTGFLVQWAGWRVAFLVPAALSIACGVAFALIAPRESEPPAKRAPKYRDLPRTTVLRVFAIMTLSAVTASLIFNFTTNGNMQLFTERLAGVVAEPATLGVLLAVVYTLASLAQLVVGKLIDRFPIKWIYLPVAAAQVPIFLLAAGAEGWWLYALALAFMLLVFGQIPFTDAMNVRFFDDRMRSRVAGTRFAVSFGISAAAVWALGPIVKGAGFDSLLLLLALLAGLTATFVLLLPDDRRVVAARDAAPPAGSPAGSPTGIAAE